MKKIGLLVGALLALGLALPAHADKIVDVQIGGDRADPRQCLFFYTDGSTTGYTSWLAVPFFTNENTPTNSAPSANYRASEQLIWGAKLSGDNGVYFQLGPNTTCDVPGGGSMITPSQLGVSK